MTARLLVLGIFGALLGGQLNRAIYRWAWNKRDISPWSAPPAGAAARTWSDCVPIYGWWLLRREGKLHGQTFWLRPLLLEVVSAVGLAALYWWEVGGGLLPPALAPRFPAQLPANLDLLVHLQFLSHAILFALMMIATFIDIDEKTIPDQVTVSGTLLGLLLATLVPDSLLPAPGEPPAQVSPLLLTSPLPWSAALSGRGGLALGLVCWFGWCYALLPKTIWMRQGLIKATRFLVASILRHRLSYWIGGLAAVGGAAVAVVWWNGAAWQGGESWQGLLTSLTGLGFGVALVWLIRAVFSAILRKEAMGFGDVTLVGMMGAFLGWQAALIIFFLAPFTSLAIAVSQWLITGRRDIPFGPFLCAAAAIVLLAWSPIWQRWGEVFRLGVFIPLVLVVAILLMAVLMLLARLVRLL